MQTRETRKGRKKVWSNRRCWTFSSDRDSPTISTIVACEITAGADVVISPVICNQLLRNGRQQRGKATGASFKLEITNRRTWPGDLSRAGRLNETFLTNVQFETRRIPRHVESCAKTWNRFSNFFQNLDANKFFPSFFSPNSRFYYVNLSADSSRVELSRCVWTIVVFQINIFGFESLIRFFARFVRYSGAQIISIASMTDLLKCEKCEK